MCLIVDVNRVSVMFGDPRDNDVKPIWKWLLLGDGCLVYGGHLRAELARSKRGWTQLVQLKRAGRAIDWEETAAGCVEKETAALVKMNVCRSNDAHIVALARVSGARVLFTEDQRAMDDFKDLRLVPAPKGRVYKRAKHATLLGHTAACRKLVAGGTR